MDPRKKAQSKKRVIDSGLQPRVCNLSRGCDCFIFERVDTVNGDRDHKYVTSLSLIMSRSGCVKSRKQMFNQAYLYRREEDHRRRMCAEKNRIRQKKKNLFILRSISID